MEIPGSKELGQVIKESRIKRGLTQEQFGEIIGKSKRTIQHYEAGTTAIPFYTLLAISNRFGISLIRLMPDYWESLQSAISFLRNVLGREPMKEEIADAVDLHIVIVEALMREYETIKTVSELKEKKEEDKISVEELADFLNITLRKEGVDHVIHIMEDSNPLFFFFLNNGNIFTVSYEQALAFWEQARNIGCSFLQEIEEKCPKATLSF